MRVVALLPMLTAAVAVVCAIWRPARRFLWPAVTLAALNVVLTPLSSGEWFYQRVEQRAYGRAVAKGDFTSFDDLLARHDPQLLGRMLVLAMLLLVALGGLAVLRSRVNRGAQPSAAVSAIAAVAVLAAAGATLAQSYFLLR